MKTENLFKSKAKTLALTFFAVLSLTSCNKDDDSNTTDVQETEAVEAVENSLKQETNGMSKSLETAVVYAEDQNLYTASPSLNCGQLYSDSYNENYSSTNYSFNYVGTFNYQLSCNSNGNPQSLSYNADREGDYDTPRMASDDEASASWSISSLDDSSEDVIFNGTYVRAGTQVSKIRNQNTFSSTLTYSIEEIAVNKSTYKITAGSASVTFVGVSSTGNQYTYNGNITFNGNDTATLVINGNTYTINL